MLWARPECWWGGLVSSNDVPVNSWLPKVVMTSPIRNDGLSRLVRHSILIIIGQRGCRDFLSGRIYINNRPRITKAYYMPYVLRGGDTSGRELFSSSALFRNFLLVLDMTFGQSFQFHRSPFMLHMHSRTSRSAQFGK